MHEVLKLRRQDHVHEQHRREKGIEEVLQRLLQLLGAANEHHRVFRRQVHLSDLRLDKFHTLAERVVGGEVGLDGDSALALEAVDLIRAARFVKPDKVGELHQLTDIRPTHRSRPQHDLADRVARRPIGMLRTQPDVVLIIRLLECADNLAADQRPQRRGNVIHPKSELARLVAIDVDLHLRLAIGERRVDVRQSGVGTQTCHQLIRILGQPRQIGADEIK